MLFVVECRSHCNINADKGNYLLTGIARTQSNTSSLHGCTDDYVKTVIYILFLLRYAFYVFLYKETVKAFFFTLDMTVLSSLHTKSFFFLKNL